MTVFEEKVVTRKHSTITGFICDKCKVFYPAEDDEDSSSWGSHFDEKLSWEHICGYNSVVGDEIKVRFDLCQNCWFELIKPFAKFTYYGDTVVF
jgi:hypothetical protein